MFHIHVPLFHLLSCNSLLHPQVKLERSRIAPIILWSIPAGWGKELRLVDHGLQHRITPAWAGKSSQPQSRPSVPEDHPRVGGEKVSAFLTAMTGSGSPPRGRGKGVNVNCSADDIGITPAQAGKSGCTWTISSAWRDHPRVGGEKSMEAGQLTEGQGSPPHGRGKVFSGCRILIQQGITPAWAGKSRGITS